MQYWISLCSTNTVLAMYISTDDKTNIVYVPLLQKEGIPHPSQYDHLPLTQQCDTLFLLSKIVNE